MRQKALLTLAIMSVALMPLAAWAHDGAAPGAGMMGSHHDFTASSPHGGSFSTHEGSPTNGDDEPIEDVGLCTYCPTPHKAFSTKLLWNHAASGESYSWTDPTTTAGTPLPSFTATYNGATAKCLSCHDGTVAIGDVALFAEKSPNLLDTRTIKDIDDFFVMVSPSGKLDGNHPVAVPYPYAGAGSYYNGSTTGPGINLSEFVSDPTVNGIRLFSDDGSGNITAGPTSGKTGIECSSCHDPHNGSTVTGDFLLRGDLTGNAIPYICLKCHNK